MSVGLPIRIPGVKTEGELGRGAYSVVFRARHGGRPCAVKVPRWRGRSHRWFRREAVALARINDPGLPGVMEVGEAEGTPYLVMELAEGVTLAERLRRSRVTEPEAMDIALQLCRILGAVHARGLVHRDIKPGNIVLDPRSGHVRLVDFGFVTQVGRSGDASSVGTRAYAAPEQLANPQTLDGRADIHALGAVLFECLTGGRMERGDEALDDDAVHAGLRRAGVGEGLARIIAGLTKSDPSERYPDTGSVSRDLYRVQEALPPLGPGVEGPRHGDHFPMLGRDQELTQLRQAWDAAREGQGRTILVRGVAGSGKSRLLQAFLDDVDACVVLQSQWDETGRAPLGTLTGMLDGFARMVQAQPETTRQRLQEGLRNAAHDQLAPLMGFVSQGLAEILRPPTLPALSPEMHEAFVEGVTEFMRRLAFEIGPLVVAVDDLQRVDPVSREVLVRVAHRVSDLPLLFVATARWDEHDGSGPRSAGFMNVMGLGPLSTTVLERLIGTYLGSAEVDPVLAKRVEALSDGTPLSVLELLEAFVDTGALAPHWGGWRFDADAVDRAQLPSGSLALLQHRLTGLPPAARRVLEAAAMVGNTFEDAIVAKVARVGPEGLMHAVSEAQRRGLVELVAGTRHRFVHERVREAFIANIPYLERRKLHATIAAVLDAFGGSEDRCIHDLATHFAQGAPHTDPARGYQVCRLAAKRAYERFDNETALKYFQWADRFAHQAGMASDAGYHRQRGEAQLRLGLLKESLASFEEAYGCVQDRVGRAELLGRIAWVQQSQDDPTSAWASLGRAFQELGERIPDENPPSVTRSVKDWAEGHALRGSRTHNPPKPEARQRLQVLCDLHYQNARLSLEHGKTTRFLQSILCALGAASRLGPSRALAKSYAMYGFALATMGWHRRGLSYLAKGQGLAKEIGDPVVHVYCLQLRGVAWYWMGDVDTGNELMRQCLEEHGHWLEAGEVCVNLFNLRLVESLRGRPRNELHWIQRAIQRMRHASCGSGALAVVEHSVDGVLACLDREDETRALRSQLGVRLRMEGRQGFFSLLQWGVRLRSLTERGALGSELEELVVQFESEDHGASRSHPVLAEYYVHVAHARVHRCLRAGPTERSACLDALDGAARDLRTVARSPLVRAHVCVIDGFRALFRSAPRRARRHLRRAESLAEQYDVPWVSYAVARAEAHLLRSEGLEEPARNKARVAAMLARENGAVHRMRFVAEEFDLEGPPRVVATSGRSETASSTRSYRRRRRQLQTLLQIARSSSRELNVEQQAREVLDELVHTLEAKRALLLYKADEAVRMEIVAGAGGGDASPLVEKRVVAHVEATGEAFMGVEPPGSLQETGTPSTGGRHVLAVPLVLKERVVGSVCLLREAGSMPFEDEDRDLLVALSYQVLSALELTRLLEQRERLEQSLRQAQKMEAVGRLAGGVAHDFNNMLTVIEAALEGLSEGEGLPHESSPPDLEMIRDATRQAKTLTRRLLAFSRRQVLRPVVCDTNEVLGELAPMIERLIGEHIRIELDLDPAAHPVKVDRASFEQALVNLAANARDAMPRGGVLTLRTRNVQQTAEWSQRHPTAGAGPHVCVSVSDTGAGMTPEVRARIFDPFFTTKAQSGTGLGLSMVYGFASQSEGHVDVQSEVGEGTTFHIYLPRPSEPLTRPSSVPPRPPPRQATETLLLVEDEPLVRNSLRRILARAGYHMLMAEGGEEAMALAEEHGSSIAVVITDVLMPSMSGPELVEALRQRLPRAKFLYISGYTDGQLEAHGVLEEGVTLVQKPFSADELKESLRTLLDEA